MTNKDRVQEGLRRIFDHGKTQSEYAREIGVAQSYLSDLLAGRKIDGLTLGTLEKIFPDLVILPFGKKAAPDVKKEISDLIERLDPERQRQALNVLRDVFPDAAKK